MARRTIEVNPFSSKSINSAIMSLQREKKRMLEFQTILLDELGKIIADQIDLSYRAVKVMDLHLNNGYFTVTPTVSKGNLEIRAEGESVWFLEFGAGIEASGSVYAPDSVGFVPGSYSELHADTYREWEESNHTLHAYPDGSYFYEQPPAHAYDDIIFNFDYYLGEALNEAVKRMRTV